MRILVQVSMRILAKILKDPMRILQRSLKDPYGDLEKIFIRILKDPQGFFEDPSRILKGSLKGS